MKETLATKQMKRVVIVIVILVASCADRDAELDLLPSRWTPAERASIVAMPSVNRPGTNEVIWRATRVIEGATHQVCLQSRPFGTFHSTYALCVFDDAGGMLEYNSISVPEHVIPRRTVSIDPVTVEFIDGERPDRGPFVCAPNGTTEEFVQFCREAEPRMQEMKRGAVER